MEENLYDMYLAGGKDFAQTKTNDSNNNDQNGIRMISLTQDGMYLTAFWSRCICGFGIENRFDPIYVMENIIPQFDPDYNYKIVDIVEWTFGSSVHACYIPECNLIFVRSDVYNRATAGNLIDVITITHEVVHVMQILIMRFLSCFSIQYNTVLCKNNSIQMQINENQTDEITSLILEPEKLFCGMNAEEITLKYIINPLIQFLCGILKNALSELKKTVGESLENELVTIPEEVICIV